MSGHGRIPPPPPHRPSSLASMFSKVPSKKSKESHLELREVFIPVYELKWETLKEWLNNRFAGYNRSFTERCIIRGDQYVVYLPEGLTEEDKNQIADLKDN